MRDDIQTMSNKSRFFGIVPQAANIVLKEIVYWSLSVGAKDLFLKISENLI